MSMSMSKEIDPQKALLTKAAKAVGLEIKYWLDGSTPMVVHKEQNKAEPRSWNPLTNDGDCFRMMVELNLAPTVYGAGSWESAESKAQITRAAMVAQAILLAREKLC